MDWLIDELIVWLIDNMTDLLERKWGPECTKLVSKSSKLGSAIYKIVFGTLQALHCSQFEEDMSSSRYST